MAMAIGCSGEGTAYHRTPAVFAAILFFIVVLGADRAANRGASMFAAAPPSVGHMSAAASGSTGGGPGVSGVDPELEKWATTYLDTHCQGSLAELDPQKKHRIIWLVKEKVERGIVRGNPSAYAQGIIRREAAGPYQGQGPPANHVQWQNPTATSPSSATPAGQAGATSSAAGSGSVAGSVLSIQTRGSLAPAAGRPEWIDQAWACHQRAPALFRIVQAHVPREALASIEILPGHLQMVCLQLLLLNQGNYSNPVVFMAAFRDMVLALPPLPAPIVAATTASPGTGKAVVVVHLGTASGFELHAAQLAIEGLRAKKAVAYLSEVLLVEEASAWRPVLDDVVASPTPRGPRVQHVPSSDAVSVLPTLARQWHSQNSAVVVVLVLPAAVSSNVHPCAVAPGYHTGPARGLWDHLKVLRMLGCAMPRLGLLVIGDPDSDSTPGDAQFFRQHFGTELLVGSTCLRVPQKTWAVRCAPYGPIEPWWGGRGGASAVPNHVDPDLLAAKEPGGSYTASLPSLATLEGIVDKKIAGETLSPFETKQLNLMLRRDAAGEIDAPPALLDRDTLADLFEYTGWAVMDSWRARFPCSGAVHPFTGQPAGPSTAGSVPCGQLRFCPSCATLYDCLTGTPCPYLYAAGLHMAFMAAHGSAEAGPGADVCNLPQHQCRAGCLGHPL